MRFLTIRHLPVMVLFGASLVLAACGAGSGTAEETLPSEISSHAEFRAWIERWQDVDEGVDITEFVLREQAGIDASAPGREPEEGELRAMSGRVLPTPDRSKFLDLHMDDGGPDSSVVLYNRRRDGLLETVAVCGTPCTYDAGFWIDSERAVVLGQTEDLDAEGMPVCADREDPWTCDRRLTVDVYDLGTGTRRRYSSSPHRFSRSPYAEEDRTA